MSECVTEKECRDLRHRMVKKQDEINKVQDTNINDLKDKVTNIDKNFAVFSEKFVNMADVFTGHMKNEEKDRDELKKSIERLNNNLIENYATKEDLKPINRILWSVWWLIWTAIIIALLRLILI